MGRRARTVQVETSVYQFNHGRKPRTRPGEGATGWAFKIDRLETIFLHGTYSQALAQAKKLAAFRVEVLP